MRYKALFLFMAAAIFAQENPAEIPAPSSNSRVEATEKLTTYWTIDTTKVFRTNVHLNRVTLFQFPSRVKFVAVGNTAEISTVVDGNCVYVKPLLGKTHSNMIVTLYSGEILTVDLWTDDHDRMSERIVFFYPDHNPLRDMAGQIKASYEMRLAQETSDLRDELSRSIPEESVKDLILYRINDSRKSTTVKAKGYLISFDGLVSTKNYTYFLFSTNSKYNEKCPVVTVGKIEIKTASRDKAALELEEFMNTADRIIVRTPIISEKAEKTKLFITLKIYEETKNLKVIAF